ncbi:MAG TPA: hypothetical protein VE998_04245 [Terriglobales bacterium]|nr:hypothetical protein [Terriglobales bacterium]
MALDAGVRCRCIEEGKAKPHPFPQLLVIDPVEGPILKPSATEAQWEQHFEWLGDPKICKHGGWIVGDFLGNVVLAENVRNALRMMEEKTDDIFPVLLDEVVVNGVHTGDAVEAIDAKRVLDEVERAEKLLPRYAPDASPAMKDFFKKMRRLAEASIATGNPIQF